MSLDPILLLAALHPDGQLFTVCAFGGDSAPWFRFADSAKQAIEFAADADRLKGREGVYHCVQNLKAKPAKGRGGEIDARNVYAVWADVDAMGHEPLASVVASMPSDPKAKKGAREAKNRAWAEATAKEKQDALNVALAAIDALPIGPPSALVTSGRGYHPYWLLDAPSEDLALVKGVNARIAELLHADNCADLARVLKVPGTRNRKIASAPEQVALVKFDGAIRYSLADLATALGAKPIALGIEAERPAKPSRTAASAQPDVPLDTEDQRVRRAVKYVEKIPGGVAGEGGHKQTWKAAVAVVRGFDLSPEQAYNVLATAYNPRCQPPWSEKDLRHKVESAASTSRISRGYLLHNGEHEKHHDVARAAARFAPESVEAMESVQELYQSEDALMDLAHLAADDPAGYASAKAALSEKFGSTLKTKDLEKAVQPLARAILKGHRSKVLRAEYGSPAAMFPDAGLPPEYALPVHHQADPVRGIGREVPSGPDELPYYETICHGLLFIVSRGVDLSTETELLELTWPRDGAWRRRDVPRGEVMSHRELAKLADHGCPVTSANAMDVVKYLDASEHANILCLKIRYVCSSMGWLNDVKGLVGFMCGSEIIQARTPCPDVTFRPNDVGDAQIVGAIRRRGNLAGWINAISVVARYPRVAFMVYASFAPPILKMLDAPNPIIDCCGPSTTGKSTVMRAAASVWGVPDERSGGLIRGANTTKVFVESVAAMMNGIPCFLDETKRVSADDLVKLIYEFSSGGGRGRGSLKGIQRTKLFQSALFLNGESPATASSKDAGTKARVLTFWGLPFGTQDETSRGIVRALTAGVAANYGHAGPEFVRWIIAHQDEAPAWRARRVELIETLADRAVGNSIAGRLAEHVATVWVAAELAHRALALPWTLDTRAMDEAWTAVLSGAEDADTPKAALDHAWSWAEGHKRQFFGITESPDTPYAGRWEKAPVARAGSERDVPPYIGFLPHMLRQVLEESGFGEEVIRTWKDRGWLATDEDRNTLAVRLDGDHTRLVAIRLTAINGEKERKPLF